jgi:dipeptidyl-peptidase-4
VANFDGTGEKQVTTDGSEKNRIKNGSGSWVYGEELSQTTAIWWSPNNREVGFYRFDEKPVRDFYLQMTQTSIQSTMDVEAIRRPARRIRLLKCSCYDVVAGTKTKMDVRDGKAVYRHPSRWTRSSRTTSSATTPTTFAGPMTAAKLLLNRTNRRQNIMELVACQPEGGKCRVIVREEWLPSWTNNRPQQDYLADKQSVHLAVRTIRVLRTTSFAICRAG